MLNNIENIEISQENLLETVKALKTESDKQFDMLVSISGVDKNDSFEVVYHFMSTNFNKMIQIKVKLDKINPVIESLCAMYPAADWHERETYDLFGIKFNNHPKLERILLPKDWIGHPLRKDYILKDDRLSWNAR